MASVIKVTDQTKVDLPECNGLDSDPKNPNYCFAFSRQCPGRTKCPTYIARNPQSGLSIAQRYSELYRIREIRDGPARH